MTSLLSYCYNLICNFATFSFLYLSHLKLFPVYSARCSKKQGDLLFQVRDLNLSTILHVYRIFSRRLGKIRSKLVKYSAGYIKPFKNIYIQNFETCRKTFTRKKLRRKVCFVSEPTYETNECRLSHQHITHFKKHRLHDKHRLGQRRFPKCIQKQFAKKSFAHPIVLPLQKISFVTMTFPKKCHLGKMFVQK